MRKSDLKVVVVGGGIGGLSAACALRRQGIEAHVYEQAPEIGEVGAGVALSPNSHRLLRRLGLGEQIEEYGGQITLGSFYFRPDGRDAAALPNARRTPTDVSYGILRTDLVSMFTGILPSEALHTGHKCIGFEQDPDSARVTFANGEIVEADVVIGADGIHSVLQHFVGEQPPPVFSGSVAYRGIVSADPLPDWPVNKSLMWLGDGKHFLVYPVRQGRKLNYVAFVPASDEMKESWSAPGDRDQLAREFEGWDPRIGSLIDQVESTFQWGLYDREPRARWSKGRLTLLGDAAHPMLPHRGQGANQSIDDGFALAAILRQLDAPVEQMLARYQDVRLERTSRIQIASRETGRRFDSQYDDLDERDAELNASASFRAWIRDHDAELIGV